MSNYTERIEKNRLPIIALSGLVAFPSLPIAFELADDRDIAAFKAAADSNRSVFLVLAKEENPKEYNHATLYNVGTTAVIKQSVNTDDGRVHVIAEPACRSKIMAIDERDGVSFATVLSKSITLDDDHSLRCEALMREALKAFRALTRYLPKNTNDVTGSVNQIRNVGLLSDFIASQVFERAEKRQEVLEIFDPVKRLEHTTVLLYEEANILKEEAALHKKVNRAIDENQHEYYLREELKVIQSELGEGSEADEYIKRILDAKLPKEVEEKLMKEAERMSHNPYGSPENAVSRGYLDTCLEIPWNKSSKTRVSVKAAKKILDADHYGLDKVKGRILEYLAVSELTPELKTQIICLVGPPGVGKTSVASSVARSMKRKFVRVSLGGVKDESDIRGHRKTYIGSMPGRIINALVKAGVKNPVILLDEIDKMASSYNGDPASALLEVLDGEQNHAFRDHYVELPVDLSECVFIATANTLETVARPLIDRMEVIELKTYTRHEKLEIARKHLIPKQLKRHGLTKEQLAFTKDAILEIADYYTAESGVRNLEREIAAICRKAALEIVEGAESKITVKAENVKKYLGNRKSRPEKISDNNEIGVVNGLAYTEVGGDMLKIEASVFDGTGKLELTGSLGDVMKESAHIALSYVRSKANELGIDGDFYKSKDIHIHVPEGAVPKDGPSAGVTLATVIASALGGYPVCRDIAMTGELTLTGNVLPIGGLREKTLAAYNAGVSRVIIPQDNEGDLDEIDPVVREKLKFIPVRRADEVLKTALCRK